MKHSKILMLAVMAALIMAGCTKNTETTSDEDAIQALIQGEYAAYFNATQTVNDSGSRDDTITSGSKGITKGLIVAWGRQITDVSTDLTINIENDTANVVVNRNLDGIFHVIWAPDTPGEVSDSIKNFTDRTERFALFVREGDPDEPVRRGWRLKGLSNLEINTQNLPDSIVRVNITKVEITKFDADDNEIQTIVLTDPSILWNRDSIPVFLPGQKVRVRVYVDKTEPSVYAYLHYNTARHRHRRDRMFYNSETECYEGVWYTPHETGIYHAAADIIETPTFHDSKYPYVSNAWIFIYQVSSE